MKNDYKLILKRNSKEYAKYLDKTIKEFNSNGKKTILYVCDTYFPIFDGVVNVMDNYAKSMVKLGYNVIALTTDYRGKVYITDYPVIAVKSVFSKLLNYQIPLPDFDGKAKKALKSLKIDLIHCHSPFFVGNMARKIHIKRNIPMISTLHSQYRQDFEKYVKVKFIVNLMMKRIMRVFNSSDEVWTMMRSAEEVLRSYGYKGKTRLIPNGTNFYPSKDYDKERYAVRTKYGVGEEPLLLFVGRLVIQKNILFVADVLKELKTRKIPFKMIFVGEGPDRKKLEKRIKENGIAEDCTLLGYVSDKNALAEIYSAADLFLFPSKYDTSSIVQVEAASRLLPGAFIKGSVTAGTVTDGVNGYVLNENEYVDGVCAALSDKGKLTEIGKNAFKDLYKNWEDITVFVEENYRDFLDGIEKSKDNKAEYRKK